MPPFYFTAPSGATEGFKGALGSEKVTNFPTNQAKDWMRGATDQIKEETTGFPLPDAFIIELLADRVVDAALAGSEFLRVEAENAGEVADVAERVGVEIDLANGN